MGLCVSKTRKGDFQGRSVSGLTPRVSASSVGFKNTRFYCETTPSGLLKGGRGARAVQRPSWRRGKVKSRARGSSLSCPSRGSDEARRPEAWTTSCCSAHRDLSHTHARAHMRVHIGWWKVPSVRRQLSGFAGTGGCCKGGRDAAKIKSKAVFF